jgi:phage terminase large subunit
METSQRQRIEQFCNKQFYEALESNQRLKIFQGGSRSGKTYSIMQYVLYLLTITKEPMVISIIRKTLPALKRSVLRDFLNISKDIGIYWDGVFNKAENTFSYNGHTLEFFSADDSQKIRGSARDIAWLNEGNELLLEEYRQLAMRTRGNIIIDFNPSDPVHWIYDLAERDDADLFLSTYKDNKFLPKELVKEIERLKERDPDYWRVYGEGQRAVFSERQIFRDWHYIPYKDFPEFDDYTIGVDFGYSMDSCAIVKVAKQNDKLYVHELLYKKGMTNRDIAEFLKNNKLNDILTFCDSAEPKSIEELRQMDIWAKPAIKGQGSINAGISLLKEFEIIGSIESKNLQKEQQSYLWDELKDGTIINKPVDKNNHLMDALRYAVYSKYKNRNDFFVL